tara:strand:+ start:308 stop:568 length:261 start_codon:yes stop_codon:yes gene_type:complete
MAAPKNFLPIKPFFTVFETGYVTYTTGSKSTVTVESDFRGKTPTVVLTPGGDVNAHVRNLSSTGFEIEVSSDNYQGNVYYHIYLPG